MTFEFKPFPDWSWSLSREKVFDECLRKYFFHYYASHNGWLKDSEYLSQKVYRLKHIQNLYLLLGEAVHNMAASLLTKIIQKDYFDEDTLINQIRGQLNQAFIDSKEKEIWARALKKKKMIHEMYYSNALPDKRVNEIKERIVQCCQNLIRSKTINDLMQDPTFQIVEVEQLNFITVANSKVYVKIDLLVKQNDRYIIVDWKTGKDDDFEDQLSIYTMYLKEKYQAGPNQIKARLENLLFGESTEYNFTYEQIEQTKHKIVSSIDQMQSYLINKETNQPKSMDYFTAFPSRYKCSNCNFIEVCEAKSR